METVVVLLIVGAAAAYLIHREVAKQRRFKAMPAGTLPGACSGGCEGCSLKGQETHSCHEVTRP